MTKLTNIGIDIDGTITDPLFLLPYLQRDFDETLEEDDFTEYDLSFINKSEEDIRDWFLSIEDELYRNVQPDEGSVQRINSLNKQYNIHLITARPKKWADVTYDWLKKNNITYDTLDVTGSHDKVEIAKERNIQLFIEDSLVNALLIHEKMNIPVLLVNAPHNQMYLPKGITRVYGWDDIEEYIEGMNYND